MERAADIEQTIKSFILSEFLSDDDPANLTYATPLISGGILDSLATLKLVAFLEQEFAISIKAHEADAEFLDTIERISNFVRSKK
jgi:acyl carrier protein